MGADDRSVIGLGSSFSSEALAAEDSLLGSLLPAPPTSDSAAVGFDDLAQANAQEETFLQQEVASTGAYDASGTVPGTAGSTDPTTQLEQALLGDLSGGSSAGTTPDEQLLNSLMPTFGAPGDATLVADSQLFPAPSVDLFA